MNEELTKIGFSENELEIVHDALTARLVTFEDVLGKIVSKKEDPKSTMVKVYCILNKVIRRIQIAQMKFERN